MERSEGYVRKDSRKVHGLPPLLQYYSAKVPKYCKLNFNFTVWTLFKLMSMCTSAESAVGDPLSRICCGSCEKSRHGEFSIHFCSHRKLW